MTTFAHPNTGCTLMALSDRSDGAMLIYCIPLDDNRYKSYTVLQFVPHRDFSASVLARATGQCCSVTWPPAFVGIVRTNKCTMWGGRNSESLVLELATTRPATRVL